MRDEEEMVGLSVVAVDTDNEADLADDVMEEVEVDVEEEEEEEEEEVVGGRVAREEVSLSSRAAEGVSGGFEM